MLTSVDVGGEAEINLPIVGISPRHSLHLRKIDGLEPPDLDIFVGDYARDGGYYQGRRVGMRPVVMTIDIHPNPALGETVSGWRDILYRTFMDPRRHGDDLQLTLHDDEGRHLFLKGYTEKFECDIFSKDTFAQISMVCPDPYIRATVPTIPNFPGNVTSTTVHYDGNAETGFETEITMLWASSGIVLELDGKKIQINYVGSDLDSTKTVYINTSRGSSRAILMAPTSEVAALSSMDITNRWIKLRRDGVTTSLLPMISADSTWLELHGRQNVLTLTSPAGGSSGYFRTISYRNSYWGI